MAKPIKKPKQPPMPKKPEGKAQSKPGVKKGY